jgi:nucleoside-diphosphate-sugar epimerase
LVGSRLCQRLVRGGDAVTVLARPKTSRWRLAEVADGLTIAEQEITDVNGVRALMAHVRPEIVFHLACSIFNPPVLTAADHLDVNVRGTLCLLEALREHPGCRFIYTSSAAELPPGNGLREDAKPGPINVYGAMKACASTLVDAYARIYGQDTMRAMLFTVYGPTEAAHRLVPSTILTALQGRTVHIRDGSVQRDMVFVEDIVNGLRSMALAALAPGTVINLSSGVGSPVRHIVEEILRLMGARVAIEESPSATRPDEIKIVSGDNARARALLGWQPQWTLADGLKESIAWASAHESMLGEVT